MGSRHSQLIRKETGEGVEKSDKSGNTSSQGGGGACGRQGE